MTVRINTRLLARGSRCILARLLIAIAITPVFMGSDAVLAAQPEGIMVHGDWEITISDNRGNLIRTHRFQNDLFASGAVALAALLSGNETVEFLDGLPEWNINMVASNGIDDGDCRYAYNDFPRESTPAQFGLTRVAVVPDDTGALTRLELTRTTVLPPECIDGIAAEITSVRTGLQLSAVYYGFSGKFLPANEVTVLPDQQVTIKVTYSFE